MLTRIDVSTHPVLGPAVSGRSLYRLIAVSKSARDGFSDWFRTRQRQLNLVERKDFIETTAPIEGKSRHGIEFFLSLDTAKKFCRLATSGRGIGVLAFLEAYELNPAIATAAETPQANAAPVESLFSKVVNSQEGALDQLKQLKPTVQVSSAPASIETPILTPAQQRLRDVQQQLEEAQKAAEDEAKQLAEATSAPGTTDELFTLLDNRIDSIEGKVNVVLTFFEQATSALRGLSTVGGSTLSHEPEEVAEPTTRMLLVRLVNSFAAAERRSEHETWKYLYGQFDLRTGLNAYAAAPNKTRDQSYLTVIEQRGQIEPLYTLAKKILVLPALK